MPARPSTSGGPNAKASAFLGLSSFSKPTAADKRMSKDDMYLTGYAGQRKKSLQPSRFGMRGGLPTPESSPDADYPPLSPPMALPPRMHTPDTLSSGEIQIGMALGSPSRPPEALPWESQPPVNRQPLTPPDLYFNAAAPVQRQKTQRRKLFGGLFGSRKKEEQPRDSLETAEFGNVTSVTTTSIASQPFGESAPTRSATVADRKAPRYKPLVVRSNTLPVMESPVHEPRSVRSKTPELAIPQPDYQQRNYLTPNPPSLSSSSATSSGPLLDIEIPSIKMERYSVMFSNVLNPQTNSSSLLARRQATLEKLKTINDRILHEVEEKEKMMRQQRRATSPQPTKSPGFTLFPPTPNRHHTGSSPLTPGRLTRSNTSPALLPSPSRPSFDHGPHPRKERKTVTIISPRSMEQRNNHTTIPRASEQQQQPERTIPAAEAESFQFGPDVSGLILDSPPSTSSPQDTRHNFTSVVDAQPLRPTIPEPEWTMIPASSASSVTTTTARRSPSSSVASSVHTHVTRPSVDTVDVVIGEGGGGGDDPALKAAVEISIARQISISRQQRTLLLRPLRTDVGQLPHPTDGRARAATVAAGSSPTVKKAAAMSRKEGRVVETKTGTPTEVRVVDAHPGAMRKSERVVLDGL
ncbi:hypothetical protein NKR19_g6619 [Coniochaeta hoffmannii]|uniref:Uncharacterized protein n=1 Tax=Coniochaeta hoffmannii TaxID=91930 RepID=A0AA38VI44_9PEZI|nr:hypothetical protein NKR19_g6619 [Coniochaeta hoffmannii]